MTEKKFPATILSPVASPAEKAIDRASADVLEAIPVSIIRWVKNPDECPVALLPWLAWEYRVDTWNTDWTEQEKRNAIKRAPYIHRHRGTAAAVRHALADSPFGSEIVEWFEQNPPGKPYTFRLNIQQKDLPVSALNHQDLRQAVLRAKNLRSWFSVHIFGRKEGKAYGYGWLEVTEVIRSRILPARIELTPDVLKLLPGEMQSVSVRVLPQSAGVRTFTARSGDTAVAVTQVAGEHVQVTSVNGRSTTITVSSTEGSASATLFVQPSFRVRVVLNIVDLTAPLCALGDTGQAVQMTVDGQDVPVRVSSDGLLYAAGPLATGAHEVTLTGNSSVSFYRYGMSFLNRLVRLREFTGSRTNMSATFRNCARLEGIDSGAFSQLRDVIFFSQAFEGCTALQAVPSDLFAGQAAVTGYGYVFFGCSGLGSLPAGLFSDSPLATGFSGAFSGCTRLTSLPDGLFTGTGDGISFYSTFASCTSLTSLPSGLFDGARARSFAQTFNGCSGLTSLPAGLFTGMTGAMDFLGTFSQCNRLTAIPAGLFADAVSTTIFSGLFSGCLALTSVPGGLFDNCVCASSMDSVFSNCRAVVSMPSGIFSVPALTSCQNGFQGCQALRSDINNIINPSAWQAISSISGLFSGCQAVTGDAQIFIGKFPATVAHAQALSGCVALTGYGTLPADWI